MTEPADPIEAAGGVLWRAGPGGPEVALVHRPKYDDWSLPKGKLHAGEHPVAGALRELAEETGCAAVPGRPLGELHYPVEGRPKRVRYWAFRAAGEGRFVPGSEVDEVAWLGLDRAVGRLSPRLDRPVLERFARDPRDTRALVVVRHASAGDRDTWPGDDRDRPLDPRGEAQADALVPLLSAYGVQRTVAAAVRRCRSTLAPTAAALGRTVEEERAATADCFGLDPDAGIAAALELARGAAAVLCTQREVIADLVAGLSRLLGRPVPAGDVGEPPKAAQVVLHLRAGSDPELVAHEVLPPPA